MAIREPHLCVFTENVRKVTQMHNRNLGSFAYVCIGAMMVGSIVMTDEKGQQVRRGDEHGYFAFGGSTIILLFPKGSVSWSEDLLENSRNQIETLIRMGETIGRINPLANSTDAAR
jgi:phosphatidylserine decarboxylase